MLSELVVCSSCAPPEHGSSSAEAYISIHDLHTYTQKAIFKKSSSAVNCLAVSPSHILTAQSDKSILNVYNRAKGSLEQILPLPEQPTAIACSKVGGLVAIGTDSGQIIVWEVRGRFRWFAVFERKVY